MLQVLTAAHKLLGDVDAVAQPAARVEPSELTKLADAIEEVQPMVSGGGQEEDDELDDEI